MKKYEWVKGAASYEKDARIPIPKSNDGTISARVLYMIATYIDAGSNIKRTFTLEELLKPEDNPEVVESALEDLKSAGYLKEVDGDNA